MLRMLALTMLSWPSIFLAGLTLSPIAALANTTYPFNQGIYKASHNSYDRDESLAAQIDGYNVWQIELDLCRSDEGLKVSHTCDVGTVESAKTLRTMLAELLAHSKTYDRRFTVIYFDLKQNWGDADAASIQDELWSVIGPTLGPHLFTPQDLAGLSQWPSLADLKGNGRFWAVIVDWHGAQHTPENAQSDMHLFTVATANPPSATAQFANAALVNVDGGCDASPTASSPPAAKGRWLYRYWPSCAQDCPQMNGDYWTNAASKGYTFIATNCVNWDHTFQQPTRSPQPLFVNRVATPSCPHGYSRCEWGTLYYPLRDVGDAIARASALTDISIKAGEYTLRDRPLTVEKPITLSASGGAVTIR